MLALTAMPTRTVPPASEQPRVPRRPQIKVCIMQKLARDRNSVHLTLRQHLIRLLRRHDHTIIPTAPTAIGCALLTASVNGICDITRSLMNHKEVCR